MDFSAVDLEPATSSLRSRPAPAGSVVPIAGHAPIIDPVRAFSIRPAPGAATIVLLLGCLLTACAPEPETAPPGDEPAASISPAAGGDAPGQTGPAPGNTGEAVIEPGSPPPRVLDLTLPEGLFAEPPGTRAESPEPGGPFDDQDLFGKQKDQPNLSVTVRPNIEPGDESADGPRIDGGSVEFKVKTE
jgi:hypothetical protein